MGVTNYECRVDAPINYVKGFMGEIVQLGATVPAGTGGNTLGIDWGPPDPNKLTGTDWRFSKVDSSGQRVFWDGAYPWKPVPTIWQDRPIGTKLVGMGIWREGAINRAQYGAIWPEDVSATWTADQQALANSTLPIWVSNIIATWSNKFDLRRAGCASSNQKCCRYSVRVNSVTFTPVGAKMGNTIVIGVNNARSNSDAWSLGDTRPGLAPHEFGHHLGAPDEYSGPKNVDTTVNTDGATAGIDPTSLMGSVPISGIPPIKARHLDVIKQFLANLVQTQQSVTWTFTAFPHS
jgi:hypothetical protein